MTQRVEPVVGAWYAHRGKGQLFQVVALDDEDGFVELQNFDGDVDEVDLDTWYAMPLDPAEPPEDWTGPVDDLDGADDEHDEALMLRERHSLGELGELSASDEFALDEELLDEDSLDAPGGLH
jgi:hypothetical protein